jgi:hypothetical protein
VLAVEVRDVGGLAEAVDAERAGAVAEDGAQPGERGGVAVEDGDQGGVRGQGCQQAGGGRGGAAGLPVGVEPVGRGDQEQAAPGTSSRSCSKASSASGVGAPVTTIASSVPGVGWRSQ